MENISGSGVYSQFSDSLDGMAFLADGKEIDSISGLSSYYVQIADELVESVCSSNFDISNKNNPGFYFNFKGSSYIVRPKSFRQNKKDATSSAKKRSKKPFSIFGMIR